MMDIQTVIDDPGSELADKPWPELNERIAGVMREFQVAAREELEVVGVEQSWILDRNRPLGLVAAWRACR